MSATGRKYEIRIAIILGFDTEPEAVAAAEAFRALTDGIAKTAPSDATGGIQCQLLETVEQPSPPPVSKGVN